MKLRWLVRRWSGKKEAFSGRPSVRPRRLPCAQAAAMPFPARVSQGVAPDHAARGQPGQADVPTGSDPWSIQDLWGRYSSHVGHGIYFAGLPTPAMAPAPMMGLQGAMYCPIGTPPGSPQRGGRARFDPRKLYPTPTLHETPSTSTTRTSRRLGKRTTKNYLVGCAFEMELLLD